MSPSDYDNMSKYSKKRKQTARKLTKNEKGKSPLTTEKPNFNFNDKREKSVSLSDSRPGMSVNDSLLEPGETTNLPVFASDLIDGQKVNSSLLIQSSRSSAKVDLNRSGRASVVVLGSRMETQEDEL